jgi:sugar phosphate isomerase/epimerase
MMKISCVTASYVADLLGYPGEIDWDQSEATIIKAPLLETIDGILKRLEPARLEGIEFWFPHIWPAKLTPILAGEIRKRLANSGMVCPACAGGVGDAVKASREAEAFYHTTRLLEAPLIAGHFASEAIPVMEKLCARYGVYAAFENGDEKDIAEIQGAIQGSNEWIGVNLDTGNLAAHGGDPVKAARTLGQRIMHVHFKDVPVVGSHDCVALGAGIVDVAGVVRELKAAGYEGWLSIEIETGDRDPTDEIILSAETLRRLLRN